MRLDVYLFTMQYARSRTHALNLIKRGQVTVNGVIAAKGSTEVTDSDAITVNYDEDFASLGGIKLKRAIDYFKLDVGGKIAIDIGASNGGFTDVLLKEGAKRVYAVDVSECALPAELATDERVVIKDKINARYITFEDIGVKADLITVDVSFISLKLIIPALTQFFTENTYLIALIKPQFEVGKSALSKKGIVISKKDEQKALKDVCDFCVALGLHVYGLTAAPHPFKDKNQEYLLLLSLR